MEIERTDVDDAKERVEEKREELERAESDLEKQEIVAQIEHVESVANSAANIAIDASVNESANSGALREVKENLEENEENIEWLRKQVHELTTQTASLREELSILKASQMPIAEVVEATMDMPATTTEISSEIKTEAPNESAEEKPDSEPEPSAPKARKIRMI
jgi:DNA mismatch repair protein MutS2